MYGWHEKHNLNYSRWFLEILAVGSAAITNNVAKQPTVCFPCHNGSIAQLWAVSPPPNQ